MPTRPAIEEVDNHNLTHVVLRNSCSCCVAVRAREQPTVSSGQVRRRRPTVIMGWMFFTSDDDVGIQKPVLVVCDLVSAAVAAVHATKHDNPRTVQAMVLTLETW